MLQTKNNKIQRGFSHSARQYDRFCGLHRAIADKLVAQVAKEPKPSVLLDVGCGTGYLTVKLKEHFPQSKVIGLDFAQEMLNVARSKRKDINWVLGDSSHLPFANGSVDVVVSNLAYQWSGDLSHAFKEVRRVLSPGGVLIGTLFAYNTCQELFQSLDEAKTGPLQFARLPSGAQIQEALIASGFVNPVVDGEQIKAEFNGMHELMSWLKSIGANNLSREGYLGPGAFSRAAAIYRAKFSYLQGVMATFEVIRVYVKK
jgi:malonyl-CoA O-methyltransferase